MQRHQKYPRRIRNTRERAATSDERDRRGIYTRACSVERGTRTRSRTHTPTMKCVSMYVDRRWSERTKERKNERRNECVHVDAAWQGSSADIWPRARSFARGTEGQRRPSPFLRGALGWIMSRSLARTHIGASYLWYRRVERGSESGGSTLHVGLQAHVTTPPVPFLWYRSQGLTPLPLVHRSTFIRAAGWDQPWPGDQTEVRGTRFFLTDGQPLKRSLSGN